MVGTKKKGTRVERELIHMFYDTGLWMPLRSAGSGSTPLPSPDLIASNSKRTLAIECKAFKGTKKYFKTGEIEELIKFSTLFGAEPWIAIKFTNKGLFFLHANNLEKTKNNFHAISFKLAKEKGLSFNQLIENAPSNVLSKTEQ